MSDDLRVMIAEHLGSDYDPTKVEKIVAIRLNPVEAGLFQEYEDGRMDAGEYADRANRYMYERFKEIEAILGTEDFLKLFDGPPPEAMIDRDIFIASEAARNVDTSQSP